MNPLVDTIRSNRPIVHCISNIVTACDCANLVLAVGASPIMAQAPEEMEDIVAIADALVLNTGTPSAEKFEACRIAGAAANKRNIPVVLDPVGVGASPWRRSHVQSLLQVVRPAIIRANTGEARALLNLHGLDHGVDSDSAEEASAVELAQKLARKYCCTVLMTGNPDIITDGEQVCVVDGGSGMMKNITGAGCMLSVLCGSFSGVAAPYEAALAAARLWKEAAVFAEKTAGDTGLGSFHAALFDYVSKQ